MGCLIPGIQFGDPLSEVDHSVNLHGDVILVITGWGRKSANAFLEGGVFYGLFSKKGILTWIPVPQVD